MPTPCWLKHLCSNRAWVPVSVFVFLPSFLPSFLPFSLTLSLCFWLIPWSVKAGCVTQGILAFFLFLLSHRQLRTTRFWSNKGPTMDWLDFLAVQGTLKSLLQHYSSKASILWCSAFIIVQLSHPHMTTGKTIALARWTFVGKVMPLLLNMLSRLVITFLPRSKRLLILGLQSPSAVILKPPKIKLLEEIKSVNIQMVI